jgi:hypothetical protein
MVLDAGVNCLLMAVIDRRGKSEGLFPPGQSVNAYFCECLFLREAAAKNLRRLPQGVFRGFGGSLSVTDNGVNISRCDR